MLDISQPRARKIMEASRHDDTILELARRMTVLPTPERGASLSDCSEHLRVLREINRDWFESSAFIEGAINDLQEGCERIANFQSSEDHTDGKGFCPVCLTELTNLILENKVVCCGSCLKEIQPARRKLNDFQGFGFCCI